jgi:hypothetical protein
VLRDAGDKKLGAMARMNDRVHGRILRLQQYMEPTPNWFVALRFDTIERNGMEQPISLKPLDDGVRSAQRLRVPLAAARLERPEGSGVFVFSEHGNMVLDRNFHSEWETR